MRGVRVLAILIDIHEREVPAAMQIASRAILRVLHVPLGAGFFWRAQYRGSPKRPFESFVQSAWRCPFPDLDHGVCKTALLRATTRDFVEARL
jgi:hypothetical protein